MKQEEKLTNLNFEKFRALAKDESLSIYEKIGFFDQFRKGKEGAIFEDIAGKLPNFSKEKQVVIDIGCGCSELPRMIIEQCRMKGHHLILIDSKEMLDQLPDEDFIEKIPAHFPTQCAELFEQYNGKADVIIIYSVFHYVVEENVMDFLDKTLGLLNHHGEALIGDIPNISKRNRFFSSPSGIEFHKANNKTDEPPVVKFNTLGNGQIDDAMMLFVLSRCRNSGYDAYVVPQDERLPMANRREDIIIVKP